MSEKVARRLGPRGPGAAALSVAPPRIRDPTRAPPVATRSPGARDSCTHDQQDSCIYYQQDSCTYDQQDSCIHDQQDSCTYDQQDSCIHDQQDSCIYYQQDSCIYYQQDSCINDQHPGFMYRDSCIYDQHPARPRSHGPRACGEEATWARGRGQAAPPRAVPSRRPRPRGNAASPADSPRPAGLAGRPPGDVCGHRARSIPWRRPWRLRRCGVPGGSGFRRLG